MLLAEQCLVNVLKQGASCANMDDLRYSQYHYSKTRQFSIYHIHCGKQDYTLEATNSQYHILIVMNTTMSISHADSYEHNNAICYDHDSEEPTFGPNPQNASTPERQKRTQRNSLKGILINTNSVKSIEKATQLKGPVTHTRRTVRA